MRTFDRRSTGATLWVLATLVLLWRFVAYAVADEGPHGWLRLALGGLGLLFVVCGLLAYFRAPDRTTLLFSIYCLCSGLHWGGPIGSSDFSGNALSVGAYVIVSSILGEAVFLHLALVLAPSWRSAWRQRVVVLLYLPAALASLFAPFVVFAGAGSSLSGIATSGFMTAYGAATLFGYVTVLILALRVFRTDRKSPAAWLLGGTVLGALPYLLHSSGAPFPGPVDAYNLFFGLVPIAGVIALRPRA